MTSSFWQTARHLTASGPAERSIRVIRNSPALYVRDASGGYATGRASLPRADIRCARRGSTRRLPAACGRASLAVALGWLALAARPSGQVFRSGVDLVNFGVTVIDKKGELVDRTSAATTSRSSRTASAQDDHLLRARGRSRSRATDLHLGLLFDTSGSMEEDIGFSRSAAIKFLNTVPDRGHHAGGLRHRGPGRAVRPERLRAAGRAHPAAEARGQTALYDAVGVYLDGAPSEEGRKMLVLYTDGGDTSSTMSLQRSSRTCCARPTSRSTPSASSPTCRSRGRWTSGRSCAAGRADRRAGVLSQRPEGPRRHLREGARRDPRAVHARLPVDQRDAPTGPGARSSSR